MVLTSPSWLPTGAVPAASYFLSNPLYFLSMKASKLVLSNGLRLLIIPMPHLASATVTVWSAVGSRYESRTDSGISHFFEHLAFKGGRRYSSAKAVSEAVDSFGGEFNASTGKENTNFYIKARIDHLDRAFDVLSDIVLSPLLKPVDIKREKGVIKAEIDMYEDTPIRKIDDVYENLVFKGSHLGRDIIGTKQTVDSLIQADFRRHLKNFYHPANMLITVAGGIRRGSVLKLAEQYFGQLPHAPKIKPSSFKSAQQKPQSITKYKKTDQVHLMLGYLGDRLGHPDRYAEAVLASVLGGCMSSRLFAEVREKRGLAYAVKTYTDHYRDTGHFTTYAGVAPVKAAKAISVILKEYQKMTSLKDCHVSNKELKKAKEYLKGRLALSLEDTSTVDGIFGYEELLLGKPFSLRSYYQGIDQVTLADLVRVARRLFQPRRLNLALIGPFKSDLQFRKLLG